MPDSSIRIEGLKVYAYHGVGRQEAVVGNDFEVDIELYMPVPGAVDTDDIADTVSYAEVIGLVREEMSRRSLLLEHVAGRIQGAVKARFPAVTGGRISIWKLCPPVGAELGRAGFSLQW